MCSPARGKHQCVWAGKSAAAASAGNVAAAVECAVYLSSKDARYDSFADSFELNRSDRCVPIAWIDELSTDDFRLIRDLFVDFKTVHRRDHYRSFERPPDGLELRNADG